MRDLLLPNRNFLRGLDIFLSILVENYLNHSYCGCLIKRGYNIGGDFQLANLPILTIEYDAASFGDNFFGCIESGCSTFFVMADIFQEFHDSFLPSHDKAEQRVAEKYVLIISDKAEIPQYQLDFLVIREIPNLLYLSNKDGKTFDLYSFHDELEMKVKDSFNIDTGQFLLNNDLYPSLYTHLNGRAIRVAAIYYLPNAYFRTVSPGAGQAFNFSNPDDEKTIFIDGTEARVILELCRKFNCTIGMNFVQGMWGEVDENRIGYGMLGSLANHETDLGYAALYPWSNVVKHLSISSPISKNEVTCLVPRPRLLPFYLTPILPFPFECWLGLLASFVALFLSLKFIRTVNLAMDSISKEGNTWNTTVFDVFSAFLLQSFNVGHDRLSNVFIFFVMVTIGIVLDNIYSGALTAVLTVPQYEKPIDTALDLADSHLQWAGNQDVWIYSIMSSTQPIILQLLKAYSSIENEELLRRSTQGNLAIVAERAQFGHVAVANEYVHIEAARMLELMRENIYWEYIVMYTPKTFPFLGVLNDVILWVAQTGIQSYWELEIFDQYVNQDIQQTILHAKDRPNKILVRLQLDHFWGAFFVLAIGCLKATLAFILELVVDRRRRRR